MLCMLHASVHEEILIMLRLPGAFSVASLPMVEAKDDLILIVTVLLKQTSTGVESSVD